MPDELTKALLLEEAASEEAIAEALFASVTGGVPLVQALIDSRAASPEVLARYLARTEVPFLRQVVPLLELATRLPPGLCARLFAIPVRRDAITGTIDVVVADASDPHPAREIAYHLGAPVRLLRASVAALEDGLHRLRTRSLPPPPEADDMPPRDDDRIFDSRPRAGASAAHRGGTLPPGADPSMRPPPPPPGARRTSVTPPWGTPLHVASPQGAPASDPPRSALGSEIPIPLTRRTYAAVSGGTQRPPPLVDPRSSLGEGYAVDPGQIRQIVELNERSRTVSEHGRAPLGRAPPVQSFIPGPPPLPGAGVFNAYAPHIPPNEIGGILAALRAAGSRDEVLELVLTGARMVAHKVAIFVVKRGGYVGWACTAEFGDRSELQAVLIPIEGASVFDEAVRDGLYLGPLRHDEVHGALLHVMRGASRDVAAVPIRVSGKTAVVVLADELGDTMLATRRLEELARAAGEAFARIVRMRR